MDREKIKAGLKLCTSSEVERCMRCPYRNENACGVALLKDALEYIEELEQKTPVHTSSAPKGILLVERGSCNIEEVDKLLKGTDIKPLIYYENTNKPELIYMPASDVTPEPVEQQLPACGFDIDMGNHDYEEE